MKPLRLFTLIAIATLMLPALAPASEDSWEHTVKEAADATWHPPLE